MPASRRSGHAVRYLALIAAVAAATVAGTAVTPAVADHGVPAVSVTLAGSLQSELGCPDDWSPPCPATALQPAGDGAWSLTVDVPAGSWAWKVALDGTWDRSYPANDVPLVLEAGARLTFTYDDTSHEVAVGPANPPEGVTEADRQLAGTSLRDDLTRERFYFVMADRFENGDPTNDTAGISGVGGPNLRDGRTRACWGGELVGSSAGSRHWSPVGGSRFVTWTEPGSCCRRRSSVT